MNHFRIGVNYTEKRPKNFVSKIPGPKSDKRGFVKEASIVLRTYLNRPVAITNIVPEDFRESSN